MEVPCHSNTSRAATGSQKHTPTSSRQLTERELEVLHCLPTRLSTNEIGAKLHISPNTVKTHLKNVYEKLGAHSRNQAILNATRQRLLSEESAAILPQ
jgi:LuxR family maltose regulon positive regulatory protein